MAQTSVVWGAASWGGGSWGAKAVVAPTPVPALPIEGLAALIVVFALLPLLKGVRKLL